MRKESAFFLTILILPTLYITLASGSEQKFEFESIPQLQNIPLMDNTCVLNTKILTVSTVNHWVYNPSIVKIAHKYLVTIRHDTPAGVTKTGFLVYDKNFEQLTPIQYYPIEHLHAQDARIFTYENNLCLSYAFLNFKNRDPRTLQEKHFKSFPWGDFIGTRQGFAQVDSAGTVLKEFKLDYSVYKNVTRYFEKNWIPFEYINQWGAPTLYLVYTFNPLKIIALTQNNQIEELSTGNTVDNKQVHAWETKWGKICGGTPALLIDNEYYLTFFHSNFKTNNGRFYVFGAITFENKPPFKLTRISKYPILHSQFYTSNTFGSSLCGGGGHLPVLFPGGFVHEKTDTGDIFHILCGENDEAVRLITISKSELLKHMEPCE